MTSGRTTGGGAGDERGRAVALGRVYDPVDPAAGARILVDRLWPRGLSKEAARLDTWLKEVAPSSGLRTWYGHERSRYREFAERYRAELDSGPAAEAFAQLRRRTAEGPVVLLTATKVLEESHLTVLRELLGWGPGERN
ncbi:DUF488 domain-containing protein [Streptomyces sp. SCSIO ZS0520]|uniref:DUF488 domain-containing protein n=1 Tax=Streptomyces sp. SCSIO ZS0520 TaxID=2892996 RepID=UPI0021D8BD5B|nr:DUF488 family protein [Streptomyces sp. SCSIO ZS0520]